MSDDTDYEAAAVELLQQADGYNGEVARGLVARAQVYATLHLAKVTQHPAPAPAKGWWSPIEHPILDGLVYGNGETLRQRLERKQIEHGEMWSQILRLASDPAETPPGEARYENLHGEAHRHSSGVSGWLTHRHTAGEKEHDHAGGFTRFVAEEKPKTENGCRLGCGCWVPMTPQVLGRGTGAKVVCSVHGDTWIDRANVKGSV